MSVPVDPRDRRTLPLARWHDVVRPGESWTPRAVHVSAEPGRAREVPRETPADRYPSAAILAVETRADVNIA